jgi:hypothetical protein
MSHNNEAGGSGSIIGNKEDESWLRKHQSEGGRGPNQEQYSHVRLTHGWNIAAAVHRSKPRRRAELSTRKRDDPNRAAESPLRLPLFRRSWHWRSTMGPTLATSTPSSRSHGGAGTTSTPLSPPSRTVLLLHSIGRHQAHHARSSSRHAHHVALMGVVIQRPSL